MNIYYHKNKNFTILFKKFFKIACIVLFFNVNYIRKYNETEVYSLSDLKIKSNSYIKRMLVPLTFIFPLLFSMGACSDVGILRASFSAVVLSLFISEFNSKALMPSLFNFLVISFVLTSFGTVAATLSLAVAGIILCFGYKINCIIEKLRDTSFISGIMLGTAIALTVLQTTNYFGIGASGKTVREMISSYISLGFHGNWRGVLYGTIVLVIMITFPRKFKAACKIVSPMFISLLTTLVLNFFLNPSDMITAINEAGKFSYNYNLDISFAGVIISITLGLIIGLTNIFSVSKEECSNKDFLSVGIINIVLSPLICFIPKKIDKTIIKNIPGALLLAVFIFIFKDFFTRVPIHSCAVILIVLAWENVKWSNVKSAFKSGIFPLILFFIPIILMLTI